MRAAGMIFFAYIGFDAVSTAAQEAKKPKRDMPIGIIGSLAICTVLYVLFAYVMYRHRQLQGHDAVPPFTTPSTRSRYDWLSTGVIVSAFSPATRR